MTYKNILIPLDGSEFSDLALEKGMELAKMADSDITILFVRDVSVYTHGSVAIGIDGIRTVLENESKTILGAAAEKLKAAGFRYSALSAEGVPGMVISDLSPDYDLIVMGPSGKTGLKKLVLGSVAQYVLTNAKCSVMAVKNKELKK